MLAAPGGDVLGNTRDPGKDADLRITRRLTATDVEPGAPAGLRRVRPLLLGLRSRFVLGVEDVTIELDNDAVVVRYEAAPGAITLEERLLDGPLSLPETVRMAADLCWGLAAGEGAGLHHGRLTPADILLGPGDQPARVVGLGLSEIGPESPAVGDGVVAGWTPPEVAAGGVADHASDLWAIGVLFRQCVGRTPLPLNLADLVARLLDRQPDRRPDSARAVATRLLGLRTTTRQGAAPLAAPRTVVAAPAPAPVAPPVVETPAAPVAAPKLAVLPEPAAAKAPEVIAPKASQPAPKASQPAPKAVEPASKPAAAEPASKPAVELPRTGLLAHPLLARLDSSDAAGLTEWRARLLRDPLFEPLNPNSLPSAREVLGTEAPEEPDLEVEPGSADPLSAPLAVRRPRRTRSSRHEAAERAAVTGEHPVVVVAATVVDPAIPAAEGVAPAAVAPGVAVAPDVIVPTVAAPVRPAEPVTPIPSLAPRTEQTLRAIADAASRRRPLVAVPDPAPVAPTVSPVEDVVTLLEGLSPRLSSTAARHRAPTVTGRRPRRPSTMAAAGIVALVGAAGGSVAYAASSGAGHDTEASTRTLSGLVPQSAPHTAAAVTAGAHPRLAPSLTPPTTAAPVKVSAPTPSATPSAVAKKSTAAASVPLPLVAPSTAQANPVQQNQLSALALTPQDVSADATSLPVPEASDFDALLQALYADCDYYTPVGVSRTAHLLSAYSSGSTIVYDDLATYPGNTAAGVLNGMATSLNRCRDLEVTQTSHNGAKAAVLGRYRVERVATPVGLPANAVALTYQRLDKPGTTVRAVLLVQGTTLRVVLASAPTLQDSDAVWAQTAATAWSLLQSTG